MQEGTLCCSCCCVLAMTRFARCKSEDIHPCVLQTHSCLSHGPNLLVAGPFRAHPKNLVHSEAWSGTGPEMGIVPPLCWFELCTLWGEASFLSPDLIFLRLQFATIGFFYSGTTKKRLAPSASLLAVVDCYQIPFGLPYTRLNKTNRTPCALGTTAKAVKYLL